MHTPREEPWCAPESIFLRSYSDVRVAASVAMDRCLRAGFPARACREVGIVAAELASNVVRHAGSGVLEVDVSSKEALLIAIDKGPGIPDVQAALQDRYSRGRHLDGMEKDRTSLGCGLGAVLRLMDKVDIETPPGGGTLVRAVKRLAPKAH